MALSNDLISQFVKATNDDKKVKQETFVYGTIVEYKGSKYVQLDGSELLTPISTTTDTKPGERVTVMIKHHTATVTGNVSSPSARKEDMTNVQQKVDDLDLDGLVDKISEFEIIVADKVTTEELNVERGRIDELRAEDVTIKDLLTAAEADIDNLQATTLTVTEKMTAAEADIDNLKATKIDVLVADAKYATIENLEATDLDVHNLEATYAEFASATVGRLDALDATVADLAVGDLSATYANIDFSNIGKAAMEYFYANSGLIDDVVVGDGTITGRLVGVTISGDLIEGNTVIAEKLVIKGSDGLYYKLNTDGMKTEAEQTDQNSLNGSIIKAKSITATKISVKDLVAFGATIGGFNITESSIYSGAKNSAGNTTRGIYLDKDGQTAFGDANRFVKFYKDTDGSYKLAIAADSILFGSNSKNVATAISDVQTSVDKIEVGGRNLLLNSASKKITAHGDATMSAEYGVEVTEWKATDAIRVYGSDGTSTIFGTLGGTAGQGASDATRSYALSIYIKNNHTTNPVTITANHIANEFVTVDPLGAKRVEIVGMGNGWGYPQINFKTANAGDEFDITYWHPKLEFGNKPTDWTPAPEDMATSLELDDAKATAENAQTRVAAAESLLEILSESISMLVTDGNGASLMTQTENGWTFSTGEIQDLVNRTSESLAKLTSDVGDTNGVVDTLRQAVSDLGAIAEYVKIGTYEDEPCIELGEADSDFKLRITNTRMMFVEGSNVLAYFNNQSLHIRKAVVEEELQQGGFVWKARSNGNVGLVWKGVNS